MTPDGSGQDRAAVLARCVGGFVLVALVLFVPAGSVLYWEAWLYLGVLFGSLAVTGVYLMRHDPETLRRRMEAGEPDPGQRMIVGFSGALVFLGLIVAGLDYRFGWSGVPVAVVIAAEAAVILGCLLFSLTLRANSHASRVVRVESGQTVIDTGPYAMVRHPMYAGLVLIFLATAPALGSYPALIPFLVQPVLIGLRIRTEETVLAQELPGYREYCRRVRYRLVPGIW